MLTPAAHGRTAVLCLAVLSLSACVGVGRSGEARTEDRAGSRTADRGGPGTGGRSAADDPRVDVDVDCAEMLEFVGTTRGLPGDPRCRRTTGLDILYEAELTAAPEDVAAWLAHVHPGAVLGEHCTAGVDRCVQVPRDEQTVGQWHFLDVEVTGQGADAAVRVTAFTT